jgi:hypothetical protein
MPPSTAGKCGVPQLGQHAFDAVGVLVHVFDEQHAALDLREIRRAHQRCQHRQVATPQRGAFHIDIGYSGLARGGVGLLFVHAPACAFAVAGQQVVKAGFHDVVGLARHTKVSPQRWPRPGGGPRLGQHGQLEGGEIAHAHKVHALFNRLGHRLVADARQDAREAIAPARDQRHIGTTSSGAVDGRQPCLVVARKTRVGGQRIGIHLDLVAQGLEPCNAALEGRLVAHGTGGRVDVDVLGTVVVVALRMVVIVVVQSAQARRGPAPSKKGSRCDISR